jgi:hypothetical protein
MKFQTRHGTRINCNAFATSDPTREDWLVPGCARIAGELVTPLEPVRRFGRSNGIARHSGRRAIISNSSSVTAAALPETPLH